MKIADKTDTNKPNHQSIEDQEDQYPEPNYLLVEVNVKEETKKKRRVDQSMIVNTGVGPGDHPDLSSGADIDAASS